MSTRKIRTPDGELKSIDEALDEWALLTEPLKSIGFIVIGYDPGVLFSCPDSKKSIDLPVAAIKRINKAIKK